MKNKQTVTIKTDEENPVDVELIAEAIIKVSEGFKAVQKSRMSQRAIVILLQDATGLTQRDINLILDYAPRLAEIYLKRQNK